MDQEAKSGKDDQTQISQRPFETDYNGFGCQIRKSRLDSDRDSGEVLFGPFGP